MSIKLKASLETVIDEWVDKESEGRNWLKESYWGETTAARMAEAAYAVMMAAHESQLWAEKNK